MLDRAGPQLASSRTAQPSWPGYVISPPASCRWQRERGFATRRVRRRVCWSSAGAPTTAWNHLPVAPRQRPVLHEPGPDESRPPIPAAPHW